MSNFKNELKGWQQVPKKLVFDNKLSDRARFVYVYMASKPEGWDFFVEPMSKELGYSADTLRKYVNELCESGWLKKEKQSTDKGRFGAVIYTLCQEKQVPKKTVTEIFRHGENPSQENADTNINSNNKLNQKINKEEKEELRSSKECQKTEDFSAEKGKTWRTDFEIYVKETNDAKERLKSDATFRAQMESVHNNVDYDKTLDNMVFSYWGLEEAWQKKKKSKAQKIDMVATLKKNFDKSLVYRPRNAYAQQKPQTSYRPAPRVENPQVDNARGDSTWVEGGILTYRNKNGVLDYITEFAPSKVPLRPSEKHDWYARLKRWVIVIGDGTISVNNKRYYEDYNGQWHEIPMDAPKMDRWNATFNYETNDWDY